MKLKALKAAFRYTIPVMTGYLFLGIAFGILLYSRGYHFGWAILMSVCIYAGSMQFVAINLLTSGFNPIVAFFMTLVINARHLFYGLAMLNRFKGMGRKKPYMIFSLTDETFSLLCSADVPFGIDSNLFYFMIAFLDQIYWIAGSAMGGVLGSAFPINTKGIDFVMTALFVVIFLDQWKSNKEHIPAVTGICGSLVCLLIFGAEDFILPSMLIILIALAALKKPIERRCSP